MPAQRMPAAEQLVEFYEDTYSHRGEQAQLYARWRALGAVGKADHVTGLCRRAAVQPASTLDLGCGDGALLVELARRGFGGALHGLEISSKAVEIAGGRPEIRSVGLYDGSRLPCADGEYELGIASHVLEHVPEPAALLVELGRACRAVAVEVPLEDNLSARRGAKREHAEEVGHLQRLSRSAMREVVAAAGLRIVAEVEDPLPLAVHVFFARTGLERAKGAAKWALRSALHGLWPGLARRLFTVHYACLCVR